MKELSQSDKQFSRRDLLKGAALLTVVYGAGIVGERYGSDVAGIFSFEKSPTSLKKEAVAEFSHKLAEAREKTIPYQPKMQTLDDVEVFAKEYVPYLAADGLLKDESLKFPPIVLKDFQQESTFANFHVLATSACLFSPETISINERHFGKYSAWRQDPDIGDLVGTVAHELGHSNQVECFSAESETVTQMVSMNTLGSMSLDQAKTKSGVTFPGFLSQMMRFTNGYVLSQSLKEEGERSQENKSSIPNPDNLDRRYGLGWYNDYLGKLPQGEAAQARWARTLRKWINTDFAKLVSIVDNYEQKPYLYTAEAMGNNDHKTKSLGLPTKDGKLDMSSTHYILTHLDDMTNAYIKVGKSSS